MDLCEVAIFMKRCEKALFQAVLGHKTRTLILIASVSKLAFLYGGGEGNRTPVRKPFSVIFSVRSLPLKFPAGRPGGRGVSLGSSFLYDGFKSERAVHIYRKVTPGSGAAVLPRRTGSPIRGCVSSLRCQS